MQASLAGALACMVCLTSTWAAEEDHPLISRYPESTVKSRTVEDFASYRLIKGQDTKGKELVTEPVEGRLTRLVYENPAGRSTLEIYRNHRQALEAAGAEVIYSCEEKACGPAYTSSRWNQTNGLFAASDGDPRYVAARLTKGEATAWVAVMVGKRRTQVDVVESSAMDTGLVAVDADALARGIEETGTVRVYGILFDFDKAEIRPESAPTLEAIGKLLQAKPDLQIFVVGHTDSTGAFDHNMRLSAARARSVVSALTARHGIAGSRLDAHGVGPLAPVAPNTTDAGRKQNRRVELVAR
jgi:OmpA-OmpF porin, OOP family